MYNSLNHLYGIPLLQLCYFHRQCQQCMEPLDPAYLPVGKCRPDSLGCPPTCVPHVSNGAPLMLPYTRNINENQNYEYIKLRLYNELSPRSVSQVDDAENVLAEFRTTVVAPGLESRELILERQTNKQMRNLRGPTKSRKIHKSDSNRHLTKC